MHSEDARALLGRAPMVSVATTSVDGTPSLVAAPVAGLAGDDLRLDVRPELVERQVSVGAHEHVVSIDGVTLWMAAQASGTLRREPGDRLARLRLDRDHLTSRAELGQHASRDERRHLLERLWQRGQRGDAEAIALLVRRFPELGTPSFLEARTEREDLHGQGYRLQCGLADDEIDEVVDLLHGLYWLEHLERADVRAPVSSSTAVVAARDGSGQIVGFARAVSDGKCAWIYDVVVAAHLRGRQLGAAIMKVLLDHPAVRGVRHVRLSTRDAMPFYRRLGFCELAEAPRYPWTSTEMIAVRRRGSVSCSERPPQPMP